MDGATEVEGCVINVSHLSPVAWCVSMHTEECTCIPPLLFSLTLVCAGPAGCRLNKAMLVEVLQTDKIQTQSQTAVSSPYNNHER